MNAFKLVLRNNFTKNNRAKAVVNFLFHKIECLEYFVNKNILYNEMLTTALSLSF